jgi:putative cardiolipin synthase
VQLYELLPGQGAAQHATARGASSGVSLHAKAIVVDRRYTFIGSLNADQRSRLLNTEMGVIVDSAPLALAVRAFFDTAIEPGNSFQVLLEPSPGGGSSRMTWRWREADGEKSELKDPGATSQRRMQVFLFSLMPIEGLL